MMNRSVFFVVLLFAFFMAGGQTFAAQDSLLVQFGESGGESATGIWWPEPEAKNAAKVSKSRIAKRDENLCAVREGASVVVWFHGGMSSGNCEKGFVAGADFAELYPEKIVVSVSACRENHWVTRDMIDAVDAALDSVAAGRKAPVEHVSLVGISDGTLGVLAYSVEGRRKVDDRLLMSSFGKFLGEPAVLASQKKMQSGRFRFLQGGKDRLYPSDQTVPWITDFCKVVSVDCELRFDPEGEHDWSYWKGKRMDWIREAIRK